MAAGAQRVFLGWGCSALEDAAKWILDQRGEDLDDVLIALPGSRAARALRQRLALRAKPSWTPPRILTQGELIDEMVVTSRPVAGRLARTLAWARALGELPRARLERLASRPPESGDRRGVLALAETVRALHADLAEEGIGFERLASGADRPSNASEARRFEVLAEAQARWHAILAELGVADPHESRFTAIDAGDIDAKRSVILVGVADMNRLLRHLVQRLGPRVTALVLAPESEADAFDELGCLRTEAWKDRDLDLPLERWHVVAGPDAQAQRALEILASFDARFAPEDVTIGVCDEEVAPHLERRLAEAGVVARHAAGTPQPHTRPHRLLADLAAWLPRRAFGAYGAFVRHPDVEAALRARLAIDVAAALDDYHDLHLPGVIDGHWLRGRDEKVREAHDAILALLGALALMEARPLVGWPPAIRAFLGAIYAEALDVADETQRVLVESLAVLSDALAEIERLPGVLGRTPSTAAEAIELVLETCRGNAISPRAPESGEPVIEVLGWLELRLDEACALVVTGFQEGFVPRSRRDDPFLPDGVRRKLGLPCAYDRVARDLYAATALVHSRTEVAFVSGRKSRTGDPLLPSRLAFHVPKRELLARVDRLNGAGDGERWRRIAGVTAGARYVLPRFEPAPQRDSMSVTAFGHFLRSPYAFYLQHVLQLETLDDSAREMDPLAFGSLAHDVLEAVGRSEVRDSTDAAEIERWLRDEVDAIGLRRFGPRPQPAVGLQLAQLAFRFEFFARVQAQRASEGWRIHRVEWKPEKQVELAFGSGELVLGAGEAPMKLRGKIDRVDVRERPGSSATEWAILDYKTGSAGKGPDAGHRRTGGGWRELQPPPYTLVARELRLPREPQLCLFKIGEDGAPAGVGISPSSTDRLGSALEAARDVVRSVRTGEFFH